jgi:spore maturation protein CgeB
MVLKRSKEDVRFYLSYHSYLSSKGEDLFFQNFSFDDKREYIAKNEKYGFNIITSLLKLRPVEYELLTMAFLKKQPFLKKDEKISTATYEEVVEWIGDGVIFNRDEIVALFFRDEPELFEAYINNHDVEF